jgi:MFS family permease
MRSAWWSSITIFLVHGLAVSTWISRIPTVQIDLGLSNSVLGLTLLGTAAGSVLAIPICGRLVDRYTSKRVTAWSTLGLCVSLVLLSLATDALSLAALLFVFGAHAGSMDVAMNAQGVEVEKAMGTPIMSRLHSMYSVGAMAGAGLGGLVAERSIPLAMHFAFAAPVLIALTLWRSPAMLEVRHARAATHEQSGRARRYPIRLFALAAIAFCMLVSEGAMADWTGVYLVQEMKASPGFAAQGFAVFSAAMALCRFFGDRINRRLGSVTTVRIASLTGALGLVAALSAPSAEWALPGFAVTGAGFSVIVPIVFAAGGRLENISPGAGIAAVTGFGYVGFLMGPPVIGYLSEWLTLRHALGLLVVLTLFCAVLAGYVRAGRSKEVTLHG